MKPTIDVYCGAPVELESERLFLAKLTNDLLERGHSALVFANFFPAKNPLQIDFFVVAANCACHVELKQFTLPVVGGLNGPWRLKRADGTEQELDRKNPYRQALDGKYAISDEMHLFARTNSSVPRPPLGNKFYTSFDAVACIFPDLRDGSHVCSDNKVRTLGYGPFLDHILRSRTNPGWSRHDWLAFAMHLGLVHLDAGQEQLAPELADCLRAVEEYRRRFIEFHGNCALPLVPTPVRLGIDVRDSTSFLDDLSKGHHLGLYGPSGCGKSHLTREMALSAVRAGRLVVFAPALQYQGRLSTLLDRSVAHLHPSSSTHLLNAATRAGKSLTLIVDGFNECPLQHRDALVKDLQAFCLRFPAAIVITAQESTPLPRALVGNELQFLPLERQHKAAIVRAYGRELTADEEDYGDPFTTAYELSIVAECLSVAFEQLGRLH